MCTYWIKGWKQEKAKIYENTITFLRKGENCELWEVGVVLIRAGVLGIMPETIESRMKES